MCCVCECYRKGLGGDGCDLASTLCKYDLRKGDLFVLSWARVQRMRWGSISSIEVSEQYPTWFQKLSIFLSALLDVYDNIMHMIINKSTVDMIYMDF